MAPPSYAELNKLTDDILLKGYHIGFWQFNCNTKTKSDILLTTTAKSSTADGELLGSVSAKCSMKEQGLDLFGKWDTKQNLSIEGSCQDIITKGLKTALECSYGVKSGAMAGKFKLVYGQDSFKFNTDFKIVTQPTINAAIVVGSEKFIFGYKTAFDTAQTALVFNDFALGYRSPEFVLTLGLDKGEEFYASAFHQTFENCHLGIDCRFGGDTPSSIGLKYLLEDSNFRLKINTDKEVCVGYQRKLHEGIELFLSANSDMKIGAAIELEA